MTKDQWFLVCIIGAFAIVAFAVGIPYLITHKGMRSPDDPVNRAEAKAYFQRKRTFFRRRQRLRQQQGTASAQPERLAGRQDTSGSPSRLGPD